MVSLRTRVRASLLSNNSPPSRGRAMIVLEHSAQTCDAAYVAACVRESIGRLTTQQLILQTLVRPLRVIVLDILTHEIVEVLLTKNQKIVKALLLNRLNESFNVRIKIWRPVRQLAHLNSPLVEKCTEIPSIVIRAVARD